MIPTTFRTDDGSRWGAGKGANLEAEEVDRNFWELKSAVEDLIANPPSPVQIASFNVVGIGFTITLTNGNVVGPLPLPVLAWRWRADWLPSAPYAQLDVFIVAHVGVFLVLLAHTSDTMFDPDAEDLSSNPLYQKLFALVPPPPQPLYFSWLGVPGTSAARSLVVPFGGTVLVPVFAFAGTQATADAVFQVNVISGGTTTVTGVGTIQFFASPTENTANFNQDSPPLVLLGNDVLQLVAPGSPDGTLADVSFSLLLQPT